MFNAISLVLLLLSGLPIHAAATRTTNKVSQERVLVIGCGHIESNTTSVECNCMRQAAKLGRHVHHGHYTVALTGISHPDVIGNIRDSEILAHLGDHKFDVIWLEHTPIDLSEDTALLSNLFQMLSPSGVLVTPLDHETDLQTVAKRCATISCSGSVIDGNGIVVGDDTQSWWKDVLSLMNEHGPIVKDRLRQALYWKEG